MAAESVGTGGGRGSAPCDEQALAPAFERAPRVVDGLLVGAPYAAVDDVVDRAGEILRSMSDRERAAVLDAHPRIGADPATLSDESRREQGDDAETRVLRELDQLNDAYERRFGFRFVVFVNRRTKAEIIPMLRARLGRTREEELATGIEEFLAIARDRLER